MLGNSPAMTDTCDDETVKTVQRETDTVPFVYPPGVEHRNGSKLSHMTQLYGEGVAPCERDAEQYNMNHPRRGRAVIFSHYAFDDPKVNPRPGTTVDVQSLSRTLYNLDFDVTIHTDLRYGELMQELSKLSKKDHKECDCLVIAVLTHGHHGNTLMSRDTPYNLKRIWEWFTADNCIDLAGKPKILIIQACKGAMDEKVVGLRPRTETDGPSRASAEAYSIPANADFLLAFSSVEGYYSNRSATTGSWFIQSLCLELDENPGRHDLLRVLTRTCRRVALDYETAALVPVTVLASDSPGHVMRFTQQMPSFISTLTRDVYLERKRGPATSPEGQVPAAEEGARDVHTSKKKQRIKSLRRTFSFKWFSKQKS